MAQSFNTSLKQVASAYAKLLKARITDSTLQKSIEENPHYPSLLSLSDTFNRFHIDNDSYRVPAESFESLEPPFIAFAKVPEIGNDFILVTSITDQGINYIHKNGKTKKLSKEEFLKSYQQVTFFAETTGKSGEADYEKRRKEEKAGQNKKRIWLAGAIALFLLACSLNITGSGLPALLSMAFIKTAGLATAILLLIFEIDKNNAFVKNICSAGSKVNCTAVLGSSASKIFGISWGEIGFFYFASTTLWLLFPGIAFSDKAIWLATANACAVPYIFFSIYYQWRVVKQWCPLCLTIQILLIAELAWSFSFIWTSPLRFYLPPAYALSLIFCVLLPIVLWYGLKPLLTRAKDLALYSAAYKRLQYNPDIFTGLLKQQAKAADGWESIGIDIGNPSASTTIIKVCNPYCGPCALAHPQLEEILEHNKDVRLKIVFTAQNSETDTSAPVVRHLLAVAGKGDIHKTRQALDDWYLPQKKDYALFATKYQMNGELKRQDEKIEAMSEWCKETGITHTPTVFINGYRLPENYNIGELKNIL